MVDLCQNLFMVNWFSVHSSVDIGCIFHDLFISSDQLYTYLTIGYQRSVGSSTYWEFITTHQPAPEGHDSGGTHLIIRLHNGGGAGCSGCWPSSLGGLLRSDEDHHDHQQHHQLILTSGYNMWCSTTLGFRRVCCLYSWQQRLRKAQQGGTASDGRKQLKTSDLATWAHSNGWQRFTVLCTMVRGAKYDQVTRCELMGLSLTLVACIARALRARSNLLRWMVLNKLGMCPTRRNKALF